MWFVLLNRLLVHTYMPAARMFVPAHARVLEYWFALTAWTLNSTPVCLGCMAVPSTAHHLLKLQTQVLLLLTCCLKTSPLEIRHADAAQALRRQQPPLEHSAAQLPPCVRGTIMVRSVHLNHPGPKLILCIHLDIHRQPASLSLVGVLHAHIAEHSRHLHVQLRRGRLRLGQLRRPHATRSLREGQRKIREDPRRLFLRQAQQHQAELRKALGRTRRDILQSKNRQHGADGFFAEVARNYQGVQRVGQHPER